jgi:hypothetical protein
MGFGGRAQMPRVSYATALDSFVVICFSFVFAVMVEYATINFLDKIAGDMKKLLQERGARKKVTQRLQGPGLIPGSATLIASLQSRDQLWGLHNVYHG